MGKTSVKAVNKYIKKAYDRINFVMPKGTKEDIAAAAEVEGVSSSEWIRNAIEEKFTREEEQTGQQIRKDNLDLSTIPDLEAYARSAGKTSAEYVREAVREKMERQDADFREDIERVDITSF